MTTIRNSALWIIFFTTFFSIFPNQALAENTPHEIAGIRLGTSVNDYPDIIPREFLKEVCCYDWHGSRKGKIIFGTCKHVDQILKIDMKYEDKSKEFYEKLLNEFRKKYGKPDEWERRFVRGNAQMEMAILLTKSRIR